MHVDLPCFREWDELLVELDRSVRLQSSDQYWAVYHRLLLHCHDNYDSWLWWHFSDRIRREDSWNSHHALWSYCFLLRDRYTLFNHIELWLKGCLLQRKTWNTEENQVRLWHRWQSLRATQRLHFFLVDAKRRSARQPDQRTSRTSKTRTLTQALQRVSQAHLLLQGS